MIQFEVGKSYALHLPAKDGHGKTTFLTDIYTVTRRTPCYLTFSHISSDGTKMPHCRCKIFTSDMRGEFVHATAFFCLYADSYIDDDSQPDENATAEITNASDNDNATASQPAEIASTQSETKAQPEIVKFEVGKTYKSVFFQSGYHFRYKFTVIDRHEKYITVRNENNGESARRTLHIDDNGVEWVNPRGTYASQKRHVLFADAPTVEPEITAHAEISQPEALYMDDSYSDAPGDNSCPDMDIPEMHTPDAIPDEIAQSEYIPDDILPLVLRLAYAESYDDIFDILNPIHSYQLRYLAHISGITQIPRCENNKKDIKFRLADKLYNQFSCIVTGYPKDFTDPISRIFKEVCSQNPRLKNAKKFPVHNNPGFTIVKRNVSIIKRPPYRKIHDTPQDECTYVTVYACDKPENTPRRNPITEAKFKWVNQFLLAVFFLCKFIIPVLCAKKSDTHKKFQIGEKYDSICYSGQPCIGKIVGFHEDHYDGEWHKAIMIEYVKNGKYKYDVAPVVTDKGVEIATWCGYPRCEFHADMLIHEATTSNHDMRTPEMRFVVGQDYRLMSYKEEKFTATITARTKNTVSFTCEELFPKGLADIRFFTAPIYIDTCIIRSECFRVPLLGVCDSANDIPTCSHNNQWCADMPDAVQEVPAEINDITPETKAQPKTRKHNPAPASELEHKLIETKDLHFSERRKGLDHNATVISSCMFSEAVISLLSSISLQAILQLGFHMRLFIAKPKGKKNVVADLFAKRLIEYRELRANVRSTSDNITANNSASVPEGVKFFETKHRQLGFIFTE